MGSGGGSKILAVALGASFKGERGSKLGGRNYGHSLAEQMLGLANGKQVPG